MWPAACRLYPIVIHILQGNVIAFDICVEVQYSTVVVQISSEVK